MSKKIHPTDVGERINDTKKEIAQLSVELERLIKSNTGLSKINTQRGNSSTVAHQVPETIKNFESGTEQIKVSDRKVIPSVIQGTTANTSANQAKTKPSIFNRNVTQNKEATREFMRHQREKREELRKNTDSKNKIDLELKKQKLQELQQKSLALVQRNLQLKRERSKSRDRNQQIRIDNSRFIASQQGATYAKKFPPKTQSNPKKQITLKSLKSKKVLDKNEGDESNTNVSHNPKVPTESRSRLSRNEKKESRNCAIVKNSSAPDFDSAARKIQKCYRKYRHRKRNRIENRQLEHHENQNPVRETKETQTSMEKQIEFPTWLQPPPIDPYPCNFINTLKKKLRLVVNSPVRTKDIGVQISQSAARNFMHKQNEDGVKLKTDLLKLKDKADSQKESNLDAEALQHFALTNFTDKISAIEKEMVKTDSESDTSKNIPEISTESGLLTDEKLFNEQINYNNLSINTDKLNKLSLRRPMQEDMSKKSYTFKFSEEVVTSDPEDPLLEKTITEKNSRSPRDSILSFNISNESEVISSSHSGVSDRNFNKKIKADKSTSSQSAQKVNSRKRLLLSQEESVKTYMTNHKNNITERSLNRTSDISEIEKLSDRISVTTGSESEILTEGRKSSQASSLLKLNILDNNGLMKKKTPVNYEIDSKSIILNDISRNSGKLSNKGSETSKKNLSSSVQTLVSTTSLRSSHSAPLNVNNKNVKGTTKEHIGSFSTSLSNNKSKTSNTIHEQLTDLSDVDVPRDISKISGVTMSKQNNISKTDTKNIHKSIEEQSKQNLDGVPLLKNVLKENYSNSNTNELHSKVVKDFKSKLIQSKNDTNEIHLKFEAEVHLLNDFNKSLRSFMAVEEAFESIKSKNETSFRNSSKNSSFLCSKDGKLSNDLSRHTSINTSRGSEFNKSFFDQDDLLKSHENSSQNLEIASVQKNSSGNDSFLFTENIPDLAGLSIKMFEQLIKDEDVRIENLKTIIKIREQALLDRTKGELAWLEIQRKHLKETGKLQEASLVKKKQRGILLKHQQERREMQRLKQAQKIQSNERKTILKEQKNMIKAKLLSEKLMTEMKIQTPRRRRSSGPVRVLKASGSLSETSISRMASEAEEIYSITSRSRSIHLSEVDSSREIILKQQETDIKKIDVTENIDKIKRALLVRQETLMKRRKAVEDLLKRHEKLLEEERKIKELETEANTIIMQIPSTTSKVPKIKSQLKELNSKILPLSDEKSADETYQTESSIKSKIEETVNSSEEGSEISTKSYITRSETSFNTFYENAKLTIDKMKKKSDKYTTESLSSNLEKGSSIQYSEDFESEKSHLEIVPNEKNLSSISELIEDFTLIEHDILMSSKQFDARNSENNSDNLETERELAKSFSLDSEGTQNLSSVSERVFIEADNSLSPKEIVSTEKAERISQKKLDVSNLQDVLASSTATETIETTETEATSEQVEDILSNDIKEEISSSEKPLSDFKELVLSEKEETVASEQIISEKELSKEEELNVYSEPGNSQTQFQEKTEIASIENETPNIVEVNTSISSNSIHSNIEIPEEKLIEISYLKNNDDSTSTDIHSNNLKEVQDENDIPEDEFNDSIVCKNQVEQSSDENIEELTFPTTESVSRNQLSIYVSEKELEEQNEQIIKSTNDVDSNQINSDKQIVEFVQKTFDASSFEVKPNIIVISPKDETFKDIPSIEKSSEMKTEDTSKDISEIKLVADDESENKNLILSDQQNSVETISEENSNLNQIKSSQSLAEISIKKNNEHSVDDENSINEEKRSENVITEQTVSDISFIGSKDSELVEEYTEDENKVSYEADGTEKSNGDDSSTNSYTDDFEDDKEEISSIPELSITTDKSVVDSTGKFVEESKVSDDVLMVKIDLKMDSSKREAEIVIMKEDSNVVHSQQKSGESDEDKAKSPIQERVSQILANTVGSQKSPRDKSIRYQDYYVTTYEDITPVNSPESVSPVKLVSINTFNNEAEELLKKQLAIELEIKHLEQQQKEQLPFVYIREIPNKPPPPYTPPSPQTNVSTILPAREEDLKEICRYSAKLLYNAYLSNNLHAVTFSETDFKIINKTNSSKECCLFVFDLCREIAENHYKKFQNKKVPLWLKFPRESSLLLGKPFNSQQLENHIHIKVKELLGFEKKSIKENSVIRWSKKKDHVDEILVLEAQAEEKEWFNYDYDELMVKNEVTDAIFDMLLSETVEIYKNIFS